jgi:flagellar hook-associated protein 1 FlgK
MASLSALNSALSGLKIASSNISLISSNISNVNTEGYTRKTQQQATVVVQGRGVGVNSTTIQRTVDAFLLRELNDQRGAAAGLETQQSYYKQIQEFHGPAEQENAISNQVGRLKDSFQALANDPSKDYLLNDVYQQAFETVNKFHDFSDLLTRLRNDAQNEMEQIVTQINALTAQISDLNLQIKASFNVNRPTADLEDQRDIALAELAEFIDVSYYERSDKVMVVQTQRGTPLVADSERELLFNPEAIGPLTYYPVSVAEIRVEDPVTGVNLTSQEGLGGRLGALIELRDETLPQYHAQLDEMAYRMTERFASQGLRLFTLPNESIPLDDPTQPSPLGYAGFAREMVINPDIVADRDLIRTGTSGNAVSIGSAELVRKIVDFTFGNIDFQEATSTIDMSGASIAAVGGTVDISLYGALENSPAITAGQDFTIDLGGTLQNITIGAGDTAADLVNTINGFFPGMAQLSPGGTLTLTGNADITIGGGTIGGAGLTALGLTAGTTTLADTDNLFGLLNLSGQTRIVGTTDIQELTTLDQSDYITPLPSGSPSDTFSIAIGGGAPTNIVINAGDTAADLVNTINATYAGLAQIGPNGNLVFDSGQSITIGNVNLGPLGLADLGLEVGTYNPVNPDFTVKVGNRQPVSIEILPTDTGDDLLTKLNAIQGLEAEFTIPDGFLQFRPIEGGDITLTDGSGNPLNAMNINVANIPHTAFNDTNIGPGGSVPLSGIGSGTTLVDYITQSVSKQSQDASNVELNLTSEQVYRDTLQRRLQDESGVNIDEEMASLVQIQNNYAASAKAIQVIEEMFNTLLQSVLR